MQAGRDALATESRLSMARGGGLFRRVGTDLDATTSLKKTLTDPRCGIDTKEAASLRLIQLDPSRFAELIGFYYEQFDLIPRGELSSFIGDLLSILSDEAWRYTWSHSYSLANLHDELKIVCHFQAHIPIANYFDQYKKVLIWGLSYSVELFSLVCQYLCANYDKLSSSELSQIVFDLKQKIELDSDDSYLESFS